MLRVVLAVFVGLVCHAQTFFSWHVIDQPFRLGEKVDLMIHQRTRTRSDALDQVRAGPIFRFKVNPTTTVYSGYYFQPVQPADDLWVKGHRLFTGVETTRSISPGLGWVGRIAAERHMRTGRPAYNRYRSYFRLLIGRGPVAPYLQNELLAVRHGFHSTRNGGGLRLRLAPHLGAELGFTYDNRQQEWGGDRAALVTALRYQWGD